MGSPKATAARPAPRTPARRPAGIRQIADVVQGGVDVVFQPIVDLDSGEIVGVEALARFRDGRGPDAWFAEASSLGLGATLELAAIKAALARLDEIPPGASLSVNVSAEVASSTELFDLLTPVALDRVVLEITEHGPVDDYPRLAEALARLRERGVRVAVDDAGAGFASMRHVLRLHPDVVKLDASLIRGIDSEPSHRALVSALVSFASATGCSLVAEGIETAAQLDAVRALGLRRAQGFHLGMPNARGPARWRVDLPRKPRAPSTTSGPRRFGSFAKPATLFLAATLSWPGLSAPAGSRREPAPAPPPAAITRAADATSSWTGERRAGPAPRVASDPTPARRAEAIPSHPPSPSRAVPPTRRTAPVRRLVGQVGELAGDVTGTVVDLLGGILDPIVDEPTGDVPRGLLGGLLGR